MDVIIPLGYAFFPRHSYASPPLQRALIMKRKELLYKQNWIIYEEDFHKKWPLIFQSMREAQVVILELQNNRYPAIIECLAFPTFSRLKELNLGNNRIATLEGLSRIDMPEVQAINLQQNHITSIRPFRKNGLRRLQYLNISNNYLTELHSFCEFPNAALGKFLLEWSDCAVAGENIVWAAKLRTIELKFLRMESKQRIRQERVSRMLLARYTCAWLWRCSDDDKQAQ